MLLNGGVGEDSWESPGLQGNPTSPSQRWSVLGVIGRADVEAETPILWPPIAKSWLIWKDPDAGKGWGLKGTMEDAMVEWHHQHNGHEWLNSRNCWWTGRPGMLWSMGSWSVEQDWVTELNWTEPCNIVYLLLYPSKCYMIFVRHFKYFLIFTLTLYILKCV